MRKAFFVTVACLMLLVTIAGALAVSSNELNAKLSDPAFSRLPKDAIVNVEVYGGDWGDRITYFVYQQNALLTNIAVGWFLNGVFSSEADFTVGVKEEFLERVLQVNDLCSFAKGLPKNPDQYRILAYDWWGFVWKYKCFSASGCLDKYCGW